MQAPSAYALGFQHGEFFRKKNPFIKNSLEATQYESGYKDGISASMTKLPGEAVLFGTVIILARFLFQAMMVIQLILLSWVFWMIAAWIVSELLFFTLFGSLLPKYIQRIKLNTQS